VSSDLGDPDQTAIDFWENDLVPISAHAPPELTCTSGLFSRERSFSRKTGPSPQIAERTVVG
jgi:hypothetical protein